VNDYICHSPPKRKTGTNPATEFHQEDYSREETLGQQDPKGITSGTVSLPPVYCHSGFKVVRLLCAQTCRSSNLEAAV
jgi:hypothetical protein